MRKFLSVVAAVAVAALGGVVILGAAPQAQEESKTEKQIKALNEKVEKLEKRVAELEKKLAEKNAAGSFEEKLNGILEQFGGKFGGGFDDLRKRLDEFRESMPDMPEVSAPVIPAVSPAAAALVSGCSRPPYPAVSVGTPVPCWLRNVSVAVGC